MGCDTPRVESQAANTVTPPELPVVNNKKVRIIGLSYDEILLSKLQNGRQKSMISYTVSFTMT